ncbi:hypothetical protein DCC39_10405 [Pueribacillus theae]|uniref:Uncharacterized protein n=1 Tax=Pueribacillus theae TaxID=2171751 RepID=A0A2U1K0V1_9BACI|nr:hypothetical protein [Pueribacillus theae]PWA11101.1 hypothetical protein DCC39_10405 [Pueribacillus theae]
MKISKQLLLKKIDKAKENYSELDNVAYSNVLHKVIDLLDNSNPTEWVAIGETIMMEGAYQMIAQTEGRKIPYDTTNIGINREDKLFTAKNTPSVS